MNSKKGLALALCLALLLGSVAALGVLPTAAAVSGATVTPITTKNQLPTDTNLLAGKLPQKEDFSGTVANLINGEQMTDGRWQGLDDVVSYKTTTERQTVNGKEAESVPGKEGEYFLYINGGWAATNVDDTRAVIARQYGVSETRFAFDMGITATVEQIAIGSSAEPKSWKIGGAPTTVESLQQRMTAYEPAAMLNAGKVYVSDDPATLFDDSNLAVSYDYSSAPLQALRNLFTLETAKEGRYVGFAFAPYSNQVRVSELAVYGDVSGVHWHDAAQGQWASLSDASEILQKSNRLKGLIPTEGTTGKAADLKNGNLAATTDGQLCAHKDDATAAIFEAPDGGWKQLTYVLGQTVNLQQFVLAGNGEGAKYTAHLIRIYVGDAPETLYTEENRVVTAEKFDVHSDRWQFRAAEARQGSYVGFELYCPANKDGKENEPNAYLDDERISNYWWTSLRIGEIGAYSQAEEPIKPITAKSDLPDSESRIANRLPKAADLSGALTNLINGEQMTDGRWQGLDDVVSYKTTTERQTVNGKEAEPVPGKEGEYFLYVNGGWAATNVDDTRAVIANQYNISETRFAFDMGASVAVEQIAIGSSAEPKSWRIGGAPTTVESLQQRMTAYEPAAMLQAGKVYVSDDPTTLFDDSHLAVSYDYSSTPLQALRNLFTLETAKEGRYVGFAFVPTGNQVRISELAVYGDYVGEPPQSVYIPHRITKESELPTADNLLAGKQIDNKSADYLIPTNKNGVPVKTDATNGLQKLTDGKIYSINTNDINKCDFSGVIDSGFAYDLRGTATITDLLVSAVGDSDAAHRITWLEVYAADSLAAVFDGEPVARLDLSADGEILWAELKNPVTTRYIGFKAPQIGPYDVVRIGELGVYGSYAAPPRPFDTALIAGMQPADTYLAWAGTPDKEMKNSVFTATNEDGMTAATDGKPGDKQAGGTFPGRLVLDTRNCHYVEGFRLSEANGGNGQKLETNTPWSVMVYYLGGTARVNTIRLISSEEPGYYVAGADFYVGDSIATLFNEENRVHTTHGEKQTKNEFGEAVLDPAYDYTQRIISCDLYDGGGKEGRYVAFVITRAYPVNTKGYSLARIGELEAEGIMLQPEEPFDSARQTITDAATGISATISRLNLDDNDFFSGLQMTVTKTALPAGVETDIEQHWLRVDSDVYTLTLKNAAGHVYTADEVGDRYWTIRIPKTGSYFQMAGQLKDGAVERVRNSRSNAEETHVLLGNSHGNAATLHGNGLQLVLLRYNDAATINERNGVLYADDMQVYNTKSAASAHREGVPAGTAAGIVGGSLLLAAGGAAGTILARRKRRSGRKEAV